MPTSQLLYALLLLSVQGAGILCVNAAHGSEPHAGRAGALQLLTTLGTPTSRIWGNPSFVAWSPDGKLLVTGDGVRDAGTLERLSGFPMELFVDGTDAGFSPNGKIMCVSTSYRASFAGFQGPGYSDLRVWDLTDLRQPRVSVLKKVLGYSGTFAFSPDSALLATVDGSQKMSFWDLGSSPPKLKSTLAESALAQQAVFARKSKRLLTVCSEPQGLHLWDLATKKVEKFPLVGLDSAVAVSADGTKIAAGSGIPHARVVAGRPARVVDLRVFCSGQPAAKQLVLDLMNAEEGEGVTGLAFSADGKGLFACTRLGAILRWDLADGDPKANLLVQDCRRSRWPASLANGLPWELRFAVRPDDKRIVTVGRTDKTIRIWDIEHDPPRRISPSSVVDQSLYMEASFHGPYLVAARLLLQPDGGDPSEKWGFQVLDTRRRPVQVESSLVLDSTKQLPWPEVSISSDGRFLAEAGVDERIHIWQRVGKGFRHALRLRLEADDRATSTRFWAGGALLGTWGEQAEIYEFGHLPPKRLTTIHEPIDHNTSQRYTAGCWAPGGKTLALSKIEGGVSLWQMDSGKPRRLGQIPRFDHPGFWFLSATSCVSVTIGDKDKNEGVFLFWEIKPTEVKLSRKLLIRDSGEWAGVNLKRNLMVFWNSTLGPALARPREIIAVDARNGHTQWRFELPGPPQRVVMSDDGELVAVVNGDGTLSLYSFGDR